MCTCRFDGFAGDLCCPKRGYKSLFLNAADDTEVKNEINHYPARTRVMMQKREKNQLYGRNYVAQAIDFNESWEDFYDDLYLDEAYESVHMRGTNTSNIMNATGVKNNPLQKPWSDTYQSITLDHYMHPIYIRAGRLNQVNQVLAHTITFDVRVKYDIEAIYRRTRVAEGVFVGVNIDTYPRSE